jgi:hypothetical protein
MGEWLRAIRQRRFRTPRLDRVRQRKAGRQSDASEAWAKVTAIAEGREA